LFLCRYFVPHHGGKQTDAISHTVSLQAFNFREPCFTEHSKSRHKSAFTVDSFIVKTSAFPCGHYKGHNYISLFNYLPFNYKRGTGKVRSENGKYVKGRGEGDDHIQYGFQRGAGEGMCVD
jgi:hypothetical protein